MFEQRNKLVEKDSSISGYLERVAVLEKNLANASAEARSPTALDTVHKYLLDGVHTDLVLLEPASKKRASAHTNDHSNYWLMRRIYTPNSASSEKMCGPKLI